MRNKQGRTTIEKKPSRFFRLEAFMGPYDFEFLLLLMTRQ